MVLPRIRKEDIQEHMLASLEKTEAEAAGLLRRVLAEEECLDEASCIHWPPEYQADLANTLLDNLGQDISERYTPEDFTQIDYPVPPSLSPERIEQLCSRLNFAFISLVLEKQSENKLNPENVELFRRIRERVYERGCDTGPRVEDFADLMNGDQERKIFHIGDSEFANETFYYYLMEWNGQAVIYKGEVRPGKKPIFTLMDFSTDSGGIAERLQGIYSTAVPKKEERFNKILGYLAVDDHRAEDYVKSVLLEALDSELSDGF
jgi:hypothetical protein